MVHKKNNKIALMYCKCISFVQMHNYKQHLCDLSTLTESYKPHNPRLHLGSFSLCAIVINMAVPLLKGK